MNSFSLYAHTQGIQIPHSFLVTKYHIHKILVFVPFSLKYIENENFLLSKFIRNIEIFDYISNTEISSNSVLIKINNM